MKILFVSIFTFGSFIAMAQQQVLEVNEAGTANSTNPNVRYVDESKIGQKSVEKYNYEDVKGTPFWDEKWNAAVAILNSNTATKIQKARLNLYANELDYIDKNGVELAAEPNLVKRVSFFKGSDTSKVIATFELLPNPEKQGVNSFYKVLNEGKVKLLILQTVELKKTDYDPIQGKNGVSLFSKYNYAIQTNETINILKSLNKSSISSFIKIDDDMGKWLKNNHNNLKRESDVIDFLNYFNKIKR